MPRARRGATPSADAVARADDACGQACDAGAGALAFVEGMVTAVSRNPGESYADFCAAMTKIETSGGKESFADRPQMPYFWARNNLNKPEEKAIGFAYSFLGIRIQCAQCHKHPFDQWSKDDFDDFRNFFGSVASTANGPPRIADSLAQYQQIVKDLELENSGLNGNQLRAKFIQLLGQGKTVPFAEVFTNKTNVNRRPPMAKKNGEGPTGHLARVLGGDDHDGTRAPFCPTDRGSGGDVDRPDPHPAAGDPRL
jgi:hypothetical protein